MSLAAMLVLLYKEVPWKTKMSSVNTLKTRFVSNRAQVPTIAERNIFGTTMVFCIEVG